MKNFAAKQYIKEIKKNIPPFYKNRKKIINTIKWDISCYIEKNGDCTYEELVREFGTTDSISVEYKTETISYEELNKVRKFYIQALLCSCAIMLCMFSIVFFYQKKKETSYKDISVTEDAENNGFRSEIYEVHGNECKKIEIDD